MKIKAFFFYEMNIVEFERIICIKQNNLNEFLNLSEFLIARAKGFENYEKTRYDICMTKIISLYVFTSI